MKNHTRCFRVKCSREKCIRVSAKNIIGVLLLSVLLISVHTLAYAQSSIDQPSESGQALSVAAPDLSEIIPAATELEGRLVAYKIRVAGLLDVSVYERNIAGFKAKLEEFSGQLQRIKETQDFRYRKLVVLSTSWPYQ